MKLFVDALERYRKLNDDEFGCLVRAALAYKATGEELALEGRVDLLWDGLRLEIDRDKVKYTDVSAARAEAGRKGAASRWQKESKSVCHLPSGNEPQGDDNCHLSSGNEPKGDDNCYMANDKNGQEEDKEKDCNKDCNKDKEQDKEKEGEKDAGVPPTSSPAPAPAPMRREERRKERRKHGAYGWVRLTDEEYAGLTAAHGQALADEKIACVDERAQQTGNKRGWKDWHMMVTKAIRENWGEKEKEAAAPRPPAPKQNRFNNFKSSPRDYAALERLELERIDSVLAAGHADMAPGCP